jgi:hypothetical protein
MIGHLAWVIICMSASFHGPPGMIRLTRRAEMIRLNMAVIPLTSLPGTVSLTITISMSLVMYQGTRRQPSPFSQVRARPYCASPSWQIQLVDMTPKRFDLHLRSIVPKLSLDGIQNQID